MIVLAIIKLFRWPALMAGCALDLFSLSLAYILPLAEKLL